MNIIIRLFQILLLLSIHKVDLLDFSSKSTFCLSFFTLPTPPFWAARLITRQAVLLSSLMASGLLLFGIDVIHTEKTSLSFNPVVSDGFIAYIIKAADPAETATFVYVFTTLCKFTILAIYVFNMVFKPVKYMCVLGHGV